MKQEMTILTVLAIMFATTTTTLCLIQHGDIQEPEDIWQLISETTTATVYNAVPSQCNEDCLHTASMYTIIPGKITEQRILAMERTMMRSFGIAYGDSVLVEGAGRYDGIWQVQDTMNKRFAGQHKIDFLVPNHIRHGKWRNVKVYKRY